MPPYSAERWLKTPTMRCQYNGRRKDLHEWWVEIPIDFADGNSLQDGAAQWCTVALNFRACNSETLVISHVEAAGVCHHQDARRAPNNCRISV